MLYDLFVGLLEFEVQIDQNKFCKPASSPLTLLLHDCYRVLLQLFTRCHQPDTACSFQVVFLPIQDKSLCLHNRFILLIQHVAEEVHLNALLKAWLYRFVETIKVILLLHSQHNGLKVCANILADLRRQVNVLHCCVGCVDDVLLSL